MPIWNATRTTVRTRSFPDYRKRKKNDRVPAFAYVVSLGTGSILTLSAMSRVTLMAFFRLLLPLSSINGGRKSASTLALLETLGTLHWLSGGGDGGGGGGGYSEGSVYYVVKASRVWENAPKSKLEQTVASRRLTLPAQTEFFNSFGRINNSRPSLPSPLSVVT
jgi:hypothetical protein